MIQFKKLVMYHFMSYRNKQVIQLAGQGIVRIEGINEDEQSADSNMAGKSTIVEALLWCLFGRTLRGLKHNQVVNRKAKKNCYVTTSFSIQGKLYLCRRYRKHREHGNRILLYRENVLISSRHESDTQTRLENILDCDYEGFVNSVVFGGFDSGTRKQFALQTDSQQKQILDSFLKFEKFEIALRRTKHELNSAKTKQHELVVKISNLSGSVQATRDRLGPLTRAIEVGNRERNKERARIRNFLKQLVSKLHRPSEKNLKQTESNVEKQIQRKAGAEEKLLGIQRQLRVLAKKRLHSSKLIGKPCPACGRKIKHSTLAALDKHFRLEKRKLRMEKEAAVKALAKIERRLLYGWKELKRLQEKQRLHENLLARKKQLEERLSALREASSNPFSEELEQASRQYSKQVSRLLAYGYEEQCLKRKIRDLEFWEKGFGNKGVKALIVRDTLPAMNAKLKEYAQEVFEGGVQLEFKPSKETKKGEERELFNLSYSTRRNANSYIAESSGGRRRVDICVLLVFAWLSRTCDILFCDELLDGLDASGRERVLSILSRERGTVFVVSHNRELKSRIGTVWTVRKKNGASRLEAQS